MNLVELIHYTVQFNKYDIVTELCIVKPLNKGYIEVWSIIPCKKTVLILEVNLQQGTFLVVPCTEVVPFIRN